MASKISFTCDNENCPGHQEVNFDLLLETWQDVLYTLEVAGWTFELEGAVVRKAICPLHKND